MRIIGGKYRGRKLAEFSQIGVRPTSDMAREALFNILQFRISGATVLDLFCGTGSLGIEALSRGAKKVTFNDGAKTSIDLLKKNLSMLDAVNYDIFNSDANAFLDRTTEKYDIIYLDPPYDSDLLILTAQNCVKVLNEGGIVILEDQKPFSGTVQGLTLYDTRKYGRIHLAFLKKGE